MIDVALGLAFWWLITYPVWSPRCRRLRKQAREGKSIHGGAISVSGNAAMLAHLDEVEADMDTWGVGPDWVQDRPYAEIWDEEDL